LTTATLLTLIVHECQNSRVKSRIADSDHSQLVLIRMPKRLLRQLLRRLDAPGSGYETLTDWIRVAVETQLALEDGGQMDVIDGSTLHSEMPRGRASADGPSPRRQTASSQQLTTGSHHPGVAEPEPPSSWWTISSSPALETFASVGSNCAPDRLSPLSNRIAPFLVGVRVLVAGVTHESDIELGEFIDRAAQVARFHALRLRHSDSVHGRRGLDKWSVGWPAGADAVKSLARFRRYYLLEKNGNSWSGPLLSLGLCVVDDGRIRPTRWAGEIAADRTGAFGESDALLSKLQQDAFTKALISLEGERSELLAFLEATASGEDVTRDALHAHLSARHAGWSEAQRTSQRAALVGRAYQLGLINVRSVDGSDSVYRISARGAEILARGGDDIGGTK